MEKEIVIASGNKGKIAEIQEILKEYKVIPEKELDIDIEVEEDQKTFRENSIKKASTIAKALNGKLVVADDSGIEIEYLDGFPGVYTKRWLPGTDRDRNLGILEKLKDVPKEKRKIKFVAAISISNGNKTITEETTADGYVSLEPRGNNGFGFDEIFELENGKTVAELSLEEVIEVRGRRKALERLRDKLHEVEEDKK